MMAGYLVRENAELRERMRKLEQANASLLQLLRVIDELKVADTRPDRYVVPAPNLDTVMRLAGLRGNGVSQAILSAASNTYD